MHIGVPKESRPGERRVAATPKTVEQIIKLGYAVSIETDAGAGASFDDAAYRAAGADVVGPEVWDADIILDRALIGRDEAYEPGEPIILKFWANGTCTTWAAPTCSTRAGCSSRPLLCLAESPPQPASTKRSSTTS